jgi:hypothetical protein
MLCDRQLMLCNQQFSKGPKITLSKTQYFCIKITINLQVLSATQRWHRSYRTVHFLRLFSVRNNSATLILEGFCASMQSSRYLISFCSFLFPGIREFKCHICHYEGVTQSDLNRHLRSQSHLYLERMGNKCKKCGEDYTSRQVMNHGHICKAQAMHPAISLGMKTVHWQRMVLEWEMRDIVVKFLSVLLSQWCHLSGAEWHQNVARFIHSMLSISLDFILPSKNECRKFSQRKVGHWKFSHWNFSHWNFSHQKFSHFGI